MSRDIHCRDCGKALGPKNRTGFCISCGNRARWSNAEYREKHREGVRRKYATDPLYKEAARRRAAVLSADPEICHRRTRRFVEMQIWKIGNAVQPAGSPARVKAGRSISDVRLAWCPKELRGEYDRLVRSKRLTAAEARTLIEELHERNMAAFRRKIIGEAL